MKRILVLRGGAIGDFVLTLPAIKLLRDAFPAARIEILGYKHIVALAEKRFYAEATRSIEYAALSSFFARDSELPAELCQYFSSFDLVLSYLFDPDRIFEENLVRAGVRRLISGSPKIQPSEHAARQLARPLAAVGLTLNDHAAHLYPSLGDLAAADKFLSGIPAPLIAFHPSSGSKTKNWPVLNWRRLADRLTDASVLIAGGEADGEEMKALASVAAHRAENLPLPLLAAVLQQCSRFIGHDSGISHIAAAVGTPCCLLFGPSDPAIWGPANKDVRIIRPPSRAVADIEIEAVLRVLSS